MTKSEAGRLGGLAVRVHTEAALVTRVSAYDASPARCKECGTDLPYKKRKNDFCAHPCAATFCNRRRYGTAPRKPGYLKNCAQCGTAISWPKTKFCSDTCEHRSRYDLFIRRWKSGEEPGHRPRDGRVSTFIRRYLIETRGEKCEKCGWCERNPATGKVPITVDHIDGRWQNAGEDNLRLLCPNCHSLTPTFQALNRGNGHPWRRETYKSRRSTTEVQSLRTGKVGGSNPLAGTT